MVERKVKSPVSVEDSGKYKLGLGIAEFFYESKIGAYLDLEFLDSVGRDANRTDNTRFYARYSIRDVMRDGADSLAHLCLPMDARNSFYRSGLTKISDLRKFLETGEWRGKHKVRDIGLKSKEMALARLALFDAEVAKLQGYEV